MFVCVGAEHAHATSTNAKAAAAALRIEPQSTKPFASLLRYREAV
jgi:hypothetical protein